MSFLGFYHPLATSGPHVDDNSGSAGLSDFINSTAQTSGSETPFRGIGFVRRISIVSPKPAPIRIHFGFVRRISRAGRHARATHTDSLWLRSANFPRRRHARATHTDSLWLRSANFPRRRHARTTHTDSLWLRSANFPRRRYARTSRTASLWLRSAVLACRSETCKSQTESNWLRSAVFTRSISQRARRSGYLDVQGLFRSGEARDHTPDNGQLTTDNGQLTKKTSPPCSIMSILYGFAFPSRDFVGTAIATIDATGKPGMTILRGQFHARSEWGMCRAQAPSRDPNLPTMNGSGLPTSSDHRESVGVALHVLSAVKKPVARRPSLPLIS